MNKHYYFNNSLDSKGKHEVHTEDCSYIEPLHNRTYIGYESNCEDAINKAKYDTGKSNFDGCFWCCRSCHRG